MAEKEELIKAVEASNDCHIERAEQEVNLRDWSLLRGGRTGANRGEGQRFLCKENEEDT